MFVSEVFGFQCFAGCKMDLPKFHVRLFILGEEPSAMKSIGHHTDDAKLLPALKAALNEDEWEQLKNSKLGVFIKFW